VLSNQIINCGITTVEILKGVIQLVFDKALQEPKYSPMYAQLCKKLSENSKIDFSHEIEGGNPVVSTTRSVYRNFPSCRPSNDCY
jgi:translation initiation factor 4G